MNIMIDLETLGTEPGSAILSIGAVVFDPLDGATFSQFYCEISTPSNTAAGLLIEPSTLKWWSLQGDTAKALLDRCSNTCPTTLMQAIESLRQWLSIACEKKSDRKVWANSPSFDCEILSYACSAVGISPLWKHYNERDCRTIIDLGRTLGIDPKKELAFIGTPHNALDDALHQANYVTAVYQHIHSLEQAGVAL